MSIYLIILIFISSAFSTESDLLENTSGCLTDEVHGVITDEEYKHLINRRKKVREIMDNNFENYCKVFYSKAEISSCR